MEKLAERKVCAICGFENEPVVLLCANPSCAADLTFSPVSRVPRPAEAAPPEAAGRHCGSGHAMAPGDAFCLECGGEAVEAKEPPGEPVGFPAVGGCMLESEIGGSPAPGGVRRFLGTHETHGPVRIVVYPERYEPDAQRQERLAGLDSNHALRLLVHGDKHELWERAEAFEPAAHDPGELAVALAHSLAHLQARGLLFRDLRPETLAVRGGAVVLGDFSQAVPADFGISLTPTDGPPHFLAPEAAVGAFREASDWWSLGALLLHILTNGQSSPAVHDRAYLMHLVTRGIRVPTDGLDAKWQHLLKGLLTRDPAKRWGGDETLRWLGGERGIPVFYENDTRPAGAKPLRLGGADCFAAADWTLAAAAGDNWDAAREQLATGVLGTWLAEAETDEAVLAELNRLRADEEIDADERLALALVWLNEHQPLSIRGDLVNGAWLLENSAQALRWLEGPLIVKLRRLERVPWLVEMADRNGRAGGLVREIHIDVQAEDFRAAGLVADPQVLLRRWRRRRRDFPACAHRGLATLAEKPAPLPEELLVLVAAGLDQFTPATRILGEAAEEAEQAGVPWDAEPAAEWFRLSRREVFRELNSRLNGFVRCGNERIDEWADGFRLDRRLSLARVLVLLAVPEESWQPPPKQEYLRHLFDYFYRKILRGVQRGPLLGLRVSANSRAIDLTELGDDTVPAEAVLGHILARIERPLMIPPEALLRNPQLERRLRHLASAATEYERDTGNRALYLGFPMLFLRPTSGTTTARPKRAPLFLWPVSLRAGAGFRGRVLIQHEAERGGDFEGGGIELNPALQSLLKPQDVERLQEMLNEATSRTHLDPRAFCALCAAALPEAAGGDFALRALPSESPAVEYGAARLMAAGGLFLCDFSQQTVAQDIRQLTGRPLQTGALKQALRLQEDGEALPADSESHGEGAPVRESEKFTILPADPSQQRAILAARRAEGLVVQGPPGTGKSQTIANIIADCLGRGETVLVVCQKQAALDVVARRLADEGLGDRFIMVMDARRGREPIIRALREQTAATAAWRRESRRASREDIAENITRLERDLSAYSNALRVEVAASGLRYAEVIDRLIASRDRPRVAAFGLRAHFAPRSNESVRRVTDQTAPLCVLWRACRYHRSPWHPIGGISSDADTLARLREHLAGFRAGEQVRATHLADGARIFLVADPRALDEWLRAHRAIAGGLDDAATRDAWHWRSHFSTDGHADADGLGAEIDALVAEASALASVPPHFDVHAPVVALDTAAFARLRADTRKALDARRGFLRKILALGACGRVRKFLAEGCGLDGDSATVDALDAELRGEQQRRHCLKRWQAIADRLGEPGARPEAEAAEIARLARNLRDRLERAKSGAEAFLRCPQAGEFGRALGAGRAEAVAEFLASADTSLRYVADCHGSHDALARLSPWFSAEWIAAKRAAIDNAEATLPELDSMEGAFDTLPDFLRFRPRFTGLADDERRVFEILAEVPEETLAGLGAHEWEAAFRHTLEHEALLGWKAAAESADAALQMGRAEFEAKVLALREASDALREANRQLLARPWQPAAIVGATRWMEILMLRGTNARRLREVIDAGGDRGLFHLRPVWLSSPETVARIFPLREGLFDVVVFDEASQMPVELAIPTLYRGRRVVVSGDRKQLPPTAFFASSQEDGSGDDEEDEHLLDAGVHLDGGLDESTRARLSDKARRREIKDCDDLLQLLEGELRNTLLTIHYRSAWRHLIEHSNAAFYERRLSIPALNPDARVREHQPLEVRRIDGTYSGQTNADEARALVEFLAAHWARPNPPSVGVVTFNLKQAELIEDLLEEKMEEDEEFRTRFVAEQTRPGFDSFFVRNLENVQGDERDWILFSTTFGRNEKGEFARKFGSLGQQGGERRLNVATTRAREKMVIFTSMPTVAIAEQHAGDGRGPRDFLKSYLTFAERASVGDLAGADALLERLGRGSGGGRSDRPVFTGAPPMRAFVREVRDFLAAHGFAPVAGTAHDAFHLDLALVDPETGRYGLAIECDPPVHEDLDSASAREIWRPALLGASIPRRVRLWSRLWLEDPDEERKRLLDAAGEFR